MLKRHRGIVVALVIAASALVSMAAAPPPTNPVQKEMRLLEAALQDAVAAIARGDVRGLPKKLHQVHVSSGDTTKAVKSGAYAPPRGKDRLDAFLALDAAFHREMITMVKAAKKNDVDTTAKQLGVLMQRCHGCHAQFRDPPPAIGAASLAAQPKK